VSNGPESQPSERRSHACEHVARTARLRSVDRVCFQRWRTGALGGFQCLDDQRRHNAPSAISAPYIETRGDPHRHIVDRFGSVLAIEPAQILSRRELTPTYNPLPVKSQQAGWGDPDSRFMECGLILLTRSLVIFGAGPPIHAPATIAGATLAEKGFEGRPQRGRKRSDGQFHVAALLLLLWGPSKDRTSVSASQSWYF
jgi:hypothetical protein